MNNLESMKVGRKYPEFADGQEGVVWDMADESSQLIVKFNKPSKKEIEQLRHGKVKYKLAVIDGIMFLLFKFGTLNYMDAPYLVHLSKNLTNLQKPGEGEGYSCIFRFYDSSTGELMAMRLLSFTNEYSNLLYKYITEQFLLDKGLIDIMDLMTRYTTQDLLNMAL